MLLRLLRRMMRQLPVDLYLVCLLTYNWYRYTELIDEMLVLAVKPTVAEKMRRLPVDL